MEQTQNTIKILHTADFHLGAAMETHLTPEKARQRRAELQARFADMITYAEEHQIDAVLLCGDLADAEALPMAAAEYLLSLMAGAAPIRFFCVPGNHDPHCFSASRMPVPENLTIFGNAWKTIALSDAVAISGRTLPADMEEEAILPAFPVSGCHIVMLHGQLSDAAGFGGSDCRISRADFRQKNIDYLALGHIHTFQYGKIDRRCTYCYPGCPEGRGYDECGEKGFVVLQAGAGGCQKAEFVPFAKRHLHDIAFDITDLPCDQHAREIALQKLLSDIPNADLVRVKICGTDSPDTFLDIPYLENRLRDRFFAASAVDLRRTADRREDDRLDISLKGEFYRQVMASSLSEEEKSAVLRCGMAALRGELRGGLL